MRYSGPRRRAELNRCIRVLQTRPLPLGYDAVCTIAKKPAVCLEWDVEWDGQESIRESEKYLKSFRVNLANAML